MRYCTGIALVAMLTGCQSFTGSFVKLRPDYQTVPEQTLREVAREIESAVSEGNRAADIQNRGGVIVDTEEIRQAIRTRAARREILSAFLDTGFAWERRNGMVYILANREYKKAGTSRDRDRNALMVASECADRWAIYEGILDASNFSPRALPAIQRIFFDARLEFMRPGQKYETESGDVGIIGGAEGRGGDVK